MGEADVGRSPKLAKLGSPKLAHVASSPKLAHVGSPKLVGAGSPKIAKPGSPKLAAASQKQAAAPLLPAAASREDNLTYDLHHMTAFDISPLHPKGDFLAYTRDSVQLLVNKIFMLPRKDLDVGSAVTLPLDELFRLPRQKPVPKAKPLTRWQKFMEERNMKKRKRSKLVWDENAADWLPRWGYKSAKHAEERANWVHEVKQHDDPGANPFDKMTAEKKLLLARQKMREVRNTVEAAGGKFRASVPDLSTTGGGANTKRGKDGLREAVKRAQVSSASHGKFDRIAQGEATNLQPKLQRKELRAQSTGEEKDRYLKAATRVLSSEGNVDRNKASKLGVSQDSQDRSGKQGKLPKTAKGGKRRSKAGGRGHSKH